METRLFSVSFGKGKFHYVSARDFEDAVRLSARLFKHISLIKSIRVVKRPRYRNSIIYRWEDLM